MKEMYQTGDYADKNPSWHEEDAPWKARHVADILSRNHVECRSICEVGCGTGDILLTLERCFPDATLQGYEIAPQAYQRAKCKETERTRFFFGDPVDLQPDRFDVLLAIDVIEHVEDYITFVKRLKPLATYKVFHIPLDLSAQSLVRSWPIMNLRSNVGHLHYFYKESALETLKSCGYTIISQTYTASRLELPNQAMSSKVMNLPRRLMFSLHEDLTVRMLGGYSLMVLAQ